MKGLLATRDPRAGWDQTLERQYRWRAPQKPARCRIMRRMGGFWILGILLLVARCSREETIPLRAGRTIRVWDVTCGTNHIGPGQSIQLLDKRLSLVLHSTAVAPPSLTRARFPKNLAPPDRETENI